MDAAIDARLGRRSWLSPTQNGSDPLLDEAAEVLRNGSEQSRTTRLASSRSAIRSLRSSPAGGAEVALLELYTWRQVPPARERQRDEPPGDFDRWSFLAEQPAALLKRNAARHAKRVRELDKVLRARQPVSRRLIDADLFAS